MKADVRQCRKVVAPGNRSPFGAGPIAGKAREQRNEHRPGRQGPHAPGHADRRLRRCERREAPQHGRSTNTVPITRAETARCCRGIRRQVSRASSAGGAEHAFGSRRRSRRSHGDRGANRRTAPNDQFAHRGIIGWPPGLIEGAVKRIETTADILPMRMQSFLNLSRATRSCRRVVLVKRAGQSSSSAGAAPLFQRMVGSPMRPNAIDNGLLEISAQKP